MAALSYGLNAQGNVDFEFDNKTNIYFLAEAHLTTSGFNECASSGQNCESNLTFQGPNYDIPDQDDFKYENFENPSGVFITTTNYTDLVAISFKEYYGNAGQNTQVHTPSFCPDDLSVVSPRVCSSYSMANGVMIYFVTTYTPPAGGNPAKIKVEITY